MHHTIAVLLWIDEAELKQAYLDDRKSDPDFRNYGHVVAAIRSWLKAGNSKHRGLFAGYWMGDTMQDNGQIKYGCVCEMCQTDDGGTYNTRARGN